ncbi:hypothetical protein N7501_001635, partial [Penicillium viridicatum]
PSTPGLSRLELLIFPLFRQLFFSILFSSPWLDLQLNCYISWSTCGIVYSIGSIGHHFRPYKASVFESSSSSSF